MNHSKHAMTMTIMFLQVPYSFLGLFLQFVQLAKLFGNWKTLFLVFERFFALSDFQMTLH